MSENLMFTVHPSLIRPEDLDPFGEDPRPAPARHERVMFVIAFAAILGVGAGALTTLFLPRSPVGQAEPGARPTTSAVARPTASTTVAGVRAERVAVVGAAGGPDQKDGGSRGASSGSSGSKGSSGSSGGSGGGAVPPTPPVALIAKVQITSPSGGAGHTAGKPLTLKVVATHPTTGAAIPGYRLHWTVTRGGQVVRTATGTSSIVHGSLITPGSYRVHVEVKATGLAGSDDVSLYVPLDLEPVPDPAPPSPTPTPQVSAADDVAVPLPDPHE